MGIHLLTTLLLLPLLTLLPWGHCQQPGLPGPAQEFLDAHNEARAQVGVGPLKWSPNLAKMTARLAMYQRLKKKCEFVDVSSSKIKYGANQLWAQGARVSPKEAVGAWVGERKYYNHTSNSCEGNHQCGVYTQVVWRKTEEVGCGEGRCGPNGTTLILCFYNPPGNMNGETPY